MQFLKSTVYTIFTFKFFFFHIFAIICQIQIGLIKNGKLYFFKHNCINVNLTFTDEKV